MIPSLPADSHTACQCIIISMILSRIRKVFVVVIKLVVDRWRAQVDDALI